MFFGHIIVEKLTATNIVLPIVGRTEVIEH